MWTKVDKTALLLNDLMFQIVTRNNLHWVWFRNLSNINLKCSISKLPYSQFIHLVAYLSSIKTNDDPLQISKRLKHRTRVESFCRMDQQIIRSSVDISTHGGRDVRKYQTACNHFPSMCFRMSVFSLYISQLLSKKDYNWKKIWKYPNSGRHS